MGAAELRALPLFDGLADEQLERLWDAGADWHFAPGDELFHEGWPADDWWVLLEGSVSLVRRVGRTENEFGQMATPGQWAGGFRAWDNHGVYTATARGVTEGRLLRVPAAALGQLAREWFPLGVHLIGGMVNTVRSIEANARQREALVALGTLAAGLAHEINNPASAATRAVATLEQTTQTVLDSLRRLAEQAMSSAQFVALDALRREAAAPSSDRDALDVADLEEELSEWLAAHGVEQEWLVAPALAAAGLDVGWCERAAALLSADQLGPAMEWVGSSLSTSSLLSEVGEATRRVSELVAAVRSYSQLDRAMVQESDVTEGLESTLVMLGHKLRGGVTVVRDYADDLPLIEAIPGELNQVWTNLVDNAVDAMDGSGTLVVSARGGTGDGRDGRDGSDSGQDGGVTVEIVDDGPGMPEEVVRHAFEPFFTTKDVGRGTGLGLDICRRIVVERHGGDIAIDSVPGRTVVRVRLPARPPEARR